MYITFQTSKNTHTHVYTYINSKFTLKTTSKNVSFDYIIIILVVLVGWLYNRAQVVKYLSGI